MLDTIHMIGHMPSEDVMQRLIQAGLELQFYPAAFAETAAENIRIGVVEGSIPLMLGIDPVPPPFLAWADIAPQQAQLGADGQIPTTDQIMQAVVQYNRQVLAAAADTAAAAADADTEATEQQQQQPLLVVGYAMKSSREDALAKAGMLHALPQQGMCFMPVDLHTLQQQSNEQQQQQQQMHIDILLHKGSDELVPLPESSTSSAAGGEGGASPAAVGVCWSPRLMALQARLAHHPSICVVDPFKHTAKVLDRYLLARLLQQLQDVQLPGGVKARGPAFWEAGSFDAGLVDAVTAAGLQPPFIVKPRVACGVSHSHSMALVLSTAGLQQLQGHLPTPALVQEFVNHGGQQYKVYVMGEQVFVTPRASIPDIHLDNTAWQERQEQQQYLLFDSLASLPTQLPPELTSPQQQQQQQQQQSSSAAGAPPPDDAVRAMAAFLRQHLGLTLFGFDVVVAQHNWHGQQQQQEQQQPQGQELVVIDVNYFPNYRGGIDVPAKFRAALRQAWEQHQQLLKV